MALALRSGSRGGQRVLALEGVDVSYGDDPVLLDVELVVTRGERVGVVGPNGGGKTTLLRVLTEELAPVAGTRWAGDGITVGYLSQAAGSLSDDATVIDALRAGRSMAEDSAVRLLMAFLFDYEQCRRPVGSLSGGERTRLAFLCLMQDAPNCLVLDEPTNHLDIDSIEALEDALERYDGTVIAVSHDRYFLDRIADRIVLVADGEVRAFEGGWSANAEIVRAAASWRSARRRLAWRAMSDASNGAGRALVSVVVPVFNESATVGQIVEELLALELHLEILLVDDGSTDASPAVLAQLAEQHTEVKVLTQPQQPRQGRRRAPRDHRVHRRLPADPGRGPRVLADGHPGADRPAARPARPTPSSARACAAVRTPQRAHLFWHYAGNRFLTLLANVLYNTTISDMEVGYKAFRGDLVRDLTLVSDDFRIEPELTAKVLRLGPDIRLFEVPISYYGRSYAEGKKITWRDGFGAVGALFRFRFF